MCTFISHLHVYITWFRRKVLMYTFSVLNLVYDSFLRDLHFLTASTAHMLISFPCPDPDLDWGTRL